MSMESAHTPLFDTASDRRVRNTSMKSEQKLLTPKEVTKWLDVSVDWVHNHATRQNPHLPVVRIAKLVDRAHDFADAVSVAIESRRSPRLARAIRNVTHPR
jgi:hypothetical protein